MRLGPLELTWHGSIRRQAERDAAKLVRKGLTIPAMKLLRQRCNLSLREAHVIVLRLQGRG